MLLRPGALTARRFPPCPPSHHASQETLQLTVGYHRLEGKLVLLKKPLAVLRRQEGCEEGEAAYEVVGVVRSKWSFKTRPLALITPVEGGSGKRAKAEAKVGSLSLFRGRGGKQS